MVFVGKVGFGSGEPKMSAPMRGDLNKVLTASRAEANNMKHGEFRIGGTFWCGGQSWRCTDIGTRTIVAIRLDQVDVQDQSGSVRTLDFVEAEAEGWFSGPPYAVAEHVFDEDSVVDCSAAPDSGIPIKRT
jgi:hypothetical protein